MSAALIGMGAIGTVYGKLLHEKYGRDFAVIAAGERGRRLEKDGCILDGKRFFPRILSAKGDTFEAGLILICVKNYQLEQAIADMRPFVKPGTVLLPLLNGITARDVLQLAFPQNRVLYGLCIRIDAVRTLQGVTHTDNGAVQFGYAANTPPTPDVLAVKDFLDAAGIETAVLPDMVRAVWKKWMMNVGCNQVSAVVGAPYGKIMSVPTTRALFHDAMMEVVALAEAARIDLTARDAQEFETMLETFSPFGKTSMLQDMEAGRRTEVENFGGMVVELGKKYGVPTPVNRVLYCVVKSLEQRNRKTE